MSCQAVELSASFVAMCMSIIRSQHHRIDKTCNGACVSFQKMRSHFRDSYYSELTFSTWYNASILNASFIRCASRAMSVCDELITCSSIVNNKPIKFKDYVEFGTMKFPVCATEPITFNTWISAIAIDREVLTVNFQFHDLLLEDTNPQHFTSFSMANDSDNFQVLASLHYPTLQKSTNLLQFPFQLLKRTPRLNPDPCSPLKSSNPVNVKQIVSVARQSREVLSADSSAQTDDIVLPVPQPITKRGLFMCLPFPWLRPSQVQALYSTSTKSVKPLKPYQYLEALPFFPRHRRAKRMRRKTITQRQNIFLKRVNRQLIIQLARYKDATLTPNAAPNVALLGRQQHRLLGT